MTEDEIIMEKSGSPIVECACSKCQNMCKTASCLGTPSDMLALIKAGFIDRLVKVDWAGLVHVGIPIVEDVIMPLFDQEKGSCTFFTAEGKCELHDLGLKPLEGKLADCKRTVIPANKIPPAIMVAYSWKNKFNKQTINKVEAALDDYNFSQFEKKFLEILFNK